MYVQARSIWQRPRRIFTRAVRAMSFAEMMVVLGFLVVMVFLLVVAVRNVIPNTQLHVAEENLNQLNASVLRFNQSNWEIVLEPDASSTDDEVAVIRSLQYRHPTRPTPGSPYLATSLGVHASTSPDTYRASWNGRQFELLGPETPGTGVDLNRINEIAAEPQYGTNYAPVGAQ